MKNLLWSLFQFLFAERIADLVKNQVADNVSKEMDVFEVNWYNRRTMVNYPHGTEVIIRSNEPDPLLVGKVSGYFYGNKHNQICGLFVKDKNTGEEFLTLDTDPFYYNDEIFAALKKLKWWDQWNIKARGICSLTEEQALRKEGMGK